MPNLSRIGVHIKKNSPLPQFTLLLNHKSKAAQITPNIGPSLPSVPENILHFTMSRQSKPAQPTLAGEIKVRKARLEDLRIGQMHISKKEHALKLQLTCATAEDDAIKKSLSAAQNQLIHARCSGLWEQYQAIQQEQERQQLLFDRNKAILRALEVEIKGVHEEWLAMEKEVVAIWGRLGKIMPFGSVEIGCRTVAKKSGNIW